MCVYICVQVIGYQQVAYVCYGEYGRVFTDSVLIFCQAGSCSAFLILVLQNVQAVFGSYGVSVHLELIALVLLPLLLLLSLPRSTTFLASAAHFGNGTMLVALATIVYYGLTAQESALGAAISAEGVGGILGVMSRLDAWSGSLNGIAVFFGISAFSFAAHCEVVAVEADAVDRQSYSRVLKGTMVVIMSLYIFNGIFAFACFADATEPNIMLNLGSDFFINLVRVTVSCTLLVNIPMALLPASQTLDLILIGPAPLSGDLPHQFEITDRDAPSTNISRSASRNLLAAADGTPSPIAHNDNLDANSWPEAEVETEAGPETEPGPVVRITAPEDLLANSSPVSGALSKEEQFKAYHRKGNWIRIAAVLTFVTFGSEHQHATPNAAACDGAGALPVHWSDACACVRVVCCSLFACSLIVRNLSIVFSLVGSIAGGITCFSLPPIFAYRMSVLERESMTWSRRVAIAMQVVFGVTLIVLGLGVIISGSG